MIRRTPRALLPVLLLAPAACQDTGDSQLLVARAEDHELTVGEAARLLAPEGELPAQQQVVEALADLWIDYTLLATAAAGDTTLAGLDMEPLVEQQAEQQMIMELRDTMVSPDTAISEAELEEIFRRDSPGARVQARHILLAWPEQADDEQRDSVRQEARQVLERIRGGADFAQVAEEVSQDPGSASRGGDLGFFGRGQMVRPFEEAAFALEPGQTSDLVESPYGLHIIKVEDRETPSLEELGPRFRAQVQQQRVFQAESAYIAGVEERGSPQVVEGATELVRELARSPNSSLSGRAARRPVVRFEGGVLTVGDVREFMQTRPPQYRQQVAGATDEQIEEGILLALAQRELLVQEARSQGMQMDPEDRDTVVVRARRAFRDAARQLGLLSIEPEPGQTMGEAIESRVEAVLQSILRGEQDVIPLGAVSFTLRRQYDSRIFPSGVTQAVEQVAELRGPEDAQPPALPGTQPGQAPPQGGGQEPGGAPTPPVTGPDTAGG